MIMTDSEILFTALLITSIAVGFYFLGMHHGKGEMVKKLEVDTKKKALKKKLEEKGIDPKEIEDVYGE